MKTSRYSSTILVLITLLSGCAATTASDLIGPTASGDPQIPAESAIRNEVKGRTIELGRVYVDRAPDAPKGELDIPDTVYIQLFRQQLEKAFHAANLSRGNQPPCRVDAAIEVTKFTDGRAIIPDPSQFWVRIELVQPDGSILMRGRLKTADLKTTPIILPGVVGVLSLRVPGAAVSAITVTFPAMAVTIARIAAGLQDGKPLNGIELFPYPDRFTAIPAHRVLLENQLGIRQMDPGEITRALRSAQVP